MPTSTLVLVQNKTINCAYVTVPQKIPVLFSRTKQIPASFIDPKKSILAKMSDPKNPSDTHVIKICEWGPWASWGVYGLRIREKNFQTNLKLVIESKGLYY